MKSGFLFKWVVGMGACSLCLTASCLEKSPGPVPVRTVAATGAAPDGAVQPVVYEVPSPGEQAPAAMPAVDIVPASAETKPATNVVTAPAQPVAAEKTLPPHVRLSAPAMEIVKLANSGVELGVMLSYVTNSMSTFNLGADEIIYLNDIGVPGIVVSAMIQRDQTLQYAAMNSGASAAQPAPGPPAPPAYPPQAEVAPQAEPTAAAYPPLEAPEAAVTYDQFYSDLAPYGSWVDVAGYGRCWQPTVVVVNPGWQPYFDCGSWVYTDCGWYWHSSYSWGWAPFHYGRWFHHGHLGWCWAPDTVWGPSWVCWRHSDAYCGWAPLPPGCGFTASGYVYHGQRVSHHDDFGLGPHDYRFVAWNDFHDRRLRGHDIPQRDAPQVFKETTVVNRMVMNNNTVINQGIAPDRVANATQHEVPQLALLNHRAGRAVTGHGDRVDVRPRTLAVYRPERPQPNQNSGRAIDRSGVPVVQGQGQTPSATPAASAPSASLATRLTGESGAPPQAPRTASRQPGVPTFARAEEPGVTEQTDGTPAMRPLPSQSPSAPASRSPLNQHSPAAQVAPLVPTRPAPTGRQPAPAATTVNPAQNPSARPAWTRPAPATPNTTPPAPATRPDVSRATPWLENRAVAPAPAPAQPQYTRPAYTPQQTYTPPTAPSRPAVAEVPRYAAPAAPSRPAMPESPRYTPPPAPAPTPHSSAVQTRSAPSAPQATPDRGSSPGNSNRR